MLRFFAPHEILEIRHVPSLAENEVHLWPFTLLGTAGDLIQCRSVLSDEERIRADRFVRDTHRHYHAIGRGVLRHMLGVYCGMDASALTFATSEAGKPRLAGAGPSSHHCWPAFNLTHSGDRAMLAVTSGAEVGVDLEWHNPNVSALEIAQRYFFGAEWEAIVHAPETQRRERFFQHWVAKEAVLKGQGTGLGFPLDQFQILFAQDYASARVHTLDSSRLDGAWCVRMLPMESGWSGAVTRLGNSWRLTAAPRVAGDGNDELQPLASSVQPQATLE